jgi:HK97 family phage portal protein
MVWPFSRKPVETRDETVLDVLGAAFGYRLGRTAVNPTVAENLSTVLSCVGAIAGGLASLPISLYRNDDNGRTEVTNHAVARLLRQPNRYQSWPSFVETTVASTLLYGNGVSVIEYDGRGAPTGLRPIQFPMCHIVLLPSLRLAYDVTMPTLYGPSTPPVRYFDDSILHIKDRSDNGLIGRSRLSRAPDVIANASSLQEYTTDFWADGMAPSGFLKHPKTLSPGAHARLKADFEGYRGGAKRKAIMLEEGLDWAAQSIDPVTAELLQSRKFSVAELCRLFNVPPVIAGDFENASLQNATQAARWFCTFTLSAWAEKVEAEIERSLLPADGSMCVEFDMTDMLRGDPEVQMESAIAAVAGGVLTANEARVGLGYPKHADGDVLRTLPGEAVQGALATPPGMPGMPAKPNGAGNGVADTMQ